jgi:hypothetical protein
MGPHRSEGLEMRAWLLSSLMLVAGCGETPGSAVNPAQATIDFIKKHGFPKLSELMPGLPAQLARVPGVETGDSGLPALPRNVAGADFEHLDALLGEAQGLAAQGFSESRRLEASLLNLVTPAYDLLGRADLFSSGENAVSGTKTLLADSGALSAAHTLFDDLISNAAYAIDTGGKNGLPNYLVLGVDAKTGAVKIAGLWPADAAKAAAGFATGFAANVRLSDMDDFDLSITFAPGKLSGLIADWSAGKCDDDVWQLALGAQPAGDKSLAITARECASSRDAVSQLALGRTGESGAWKLTGAFAQNFPGADPDTLRGFMGERQGFVMQAAAASDLSKLAGAAAVLSASDFAAPTQEKIDQFGVGSILARFFQERYFTPKVKAAETDDFAYWLCKVPFVKSAVAEESPNTGALCDGTSLDVESILDTLGSLRSTLKSVPLLPSGVTKEVGGAIDVLSIRNSLFVGGDGDLTYKKAPDSTYSDLDTARKGALPGAIGNTQWLGGAQAALPTVMAADVPNTAYKALSAGLGGFLKEKCKALAGDAQDKAGKTENTSGFCG